MAQFFEQTLGLSVGYRPTFNFSGIWLWGANNPLIHLSELTPDERPQSVNLALGNALHTLARMKTDATPMEGIDVERVNQTFKKELEGYRCDAALAIGYQHLEQDYNALLPRSRCALKRILKRL